MCDESLSLLLSRENKVYISYMYVTANVTHMFFVRFSFWRFLPFQACFASDGKTSLRRLKSPETTTDTQHVNKFCWFYAQNVHISKYLPVVAKQA